MLKTVTSTMDSEDGKIFIKQLAHFIRVHERALANALTGQETRNKNGASQAGAAKNGTATSPTPLPISLSTSRPSYFSFQTPKIRPSKLSLTPHHLYYLLSQFEDLGVDVGPMKVRLEDMNSTATPSEYTSFLGHAPKSKGKQVSDADSMRSVSSIRSVMSTVSSIWSNLSLSNSISKVEKQLAQHQDDLKYLYSCFTKLPALRLAPDSRLRMISGFEMQPFDIAVPLFAFKNVSSLEICDLDFRLFHGWDRLTTNLRSLTVRRSNLDDPLDLLLNIVLDDYTGKRTRSSTTQVPTTPSTPGVPWPLSNSPRIRQVDIARSLSTPDSSFTEQRRNSLGTPHSLRLARGGSTDGMKAPTVTGPMSGGDSPVRPPGSRHGSLHKPRKSTSQIYRRSSGSSGSSSLDGTSRQSTSDLLGHSNPFSVHLQWSCLRHLSLAENGIAFLSATSFAPVADTLQSLDLSGNLLTSIPDLSLLTHLCALNLSNCMIDSLRSLTSTPLPAVSTLNLRANRLLQLSGIERLPALERVDLRDNKLRDPTELNRLTSLPNVTDVYVAKNPFTKNSHSSTYRVVIFNLFRKAPGYTEDVTIDNFGPLSTEKKLLVDRVPELANVPVVQPHLEDEDHAQVPGARFASAAMIDDADIPLPLAQPAPVQTRQRSHRRTNSDMGPDTMRRKKKGSRRRIVELKPGDVIAAPSKDVPVAQTVELPPLTPSVSNEPTTPEVTPTEPPTTQLATPQVPALRPPLSTTYTSPSTAPHIRDPSDDDEGSLLSPIEVDSRSVLYSHNDALSKSDVGKEWLTQMSQDSQIPADKPEGRERSFSPHSRSSTIRPEQPHREVRFQQMENDPKS